MVREVPFITGEYYHIYNRGVAKQPIFLTERHYRRFERTIEFYRFRHHKLSFSVYLKSKFKQVPLSNPQSLETKISQVKIIAYSFMPNHYHFLVQQLVDGGISYFMKELSNSYTRYFNTVTKRVGPLFQGPFKSKAVQSETYLLHLSRYIHINSLQARISTIKSVCDYPWSSLSQFVSGTPAGTIVVEPSIVLEQFNNNLDAYKKFCLDISDYGYTIESFSEFLIDPTE